MRAQPDYPFVTAAIEAFADWWTQRRHRSREFDVLSRSDLEAVAKDIGVAAADLRTLDAASFRSRGA